MSPDAPDNYAFGEAELKLPRVVVDLARAEPPSTGCAWVSHALTGDPWLDGGLGRIGELVSQISDEDSGSALLARSIDALDRATTESELVHAQQELSDLLRASAYLVGLLLVQLHPKWVGQTLLGGRRLTDHSPHRLLYLWLAQRLSQAVADPMLRQEAVGATVHARTAVVRTLGTLQLIADRLILAAEEDREPDIPPV
jgi:hypothetical protein